MSGPRYTDLLNSLPATVPFVGPEVTERSTGRAFTARLGANENGFGLSPRAIEAMQRATAEVWMYGDSANHDLRHALAAHHGCAPEQIIIGEGIDGLLGYLVRMMVGPGDAVVTSDGAYPTFNYHVAGFGGVLHKVPYNGNHEDPDALIAATQKLRPKLVYIANPDNPMGSWHDAARMRAMIDALPEGSLMVLDEAYIEFAPEGTAPVIDPEDPRVIRFRTFSKAYGMAGARVGYGIGARDLIARFDRIRNHFGMCRISQAGALAALNDQDWLSGLIAQVAASRHEIARIGAENGLTALPSATNFVTLDCGGNAARARAIVAALADRKVFIRMPFVAPHDRCIRISTGPDAAIRALASALPEALHAVKAKE